MRARAGRAQRGPRRAGRGGRGSTWRQGRSPSGGAHRLASRGRSRRRGVEQQEAAGARPLQGRVGRVVLGALGRVLPDAHGEQLSYASTQHRAPRARRACARRVGLGWGCGASSHCRPPPPLTAHPRACVPSHVCQAEARLQWFTEQAEQHAVALRASEARAKAEGARGGLSAHRSRKRICASMVGSTGRWRAQASWAAPRGRSPRPERLSCKSTPAYSSAPPPELGRRASTRWRRRCAWWQGAWSTSSS